MAFLVKLQRRMRGGRIQMSRVSLLNQLYGEKKTALEFNFDRLSIPPMNLFLSVIDIQRLHQIATSVRYAGNIDKKYEMIDKVMKHRSFHKLAAGTNRVVYYHLEDPRFVAKIAIDKVGLGDNPKEFKNQEYLKPFCTKVFEVDETGTVALVERVNPITSIEEFASVGEDVFNLITQKIIGKYVLDDIGVTKWMNYGCRMNGFGPVILDFPYVYELDGNKIYCQKKVQTLYGEHICGGEIDYDSSFDFLVCSKCGKKYKARDLENKNTTIKLEMNSEGSTGIMTRARIMKNGKVWKDSAPSSRTYVSKEQFDKMVGNVDLSKDVVVDKVVHLRSMKRENKNKYYSNLMMEYYKKSNATPAKINGLKKPVQTSSVPVAQKPERKYQSKIKSSKARIVNTTEEPDLIDPLGCNEEAIALEYLKQHRNENTAGKTARIRVNVKLDQPTVDSSCIFPYDSNIRNAVEERTSSPEYQPPTVPPIASNERIEMTEFVPVGIMSAQELIEANAKSMIEEILENEDNVTKIETAIDEIDSDKEDTLDRITTYANEDILSEEIAGMNEVEDSITEQAIELIKQGMFHNFEEPSYKDEYPEKEAEEQEEIKPPVYANDYDEEEEEIPFDNYRDVYHKRKKIRNDDMSEF